MTPKPEQLTIREFQPGDQPAFRRLNEEWILRDFAMEPKDEECLNHPENTILSSGGRIFFAILDGRAVGCCALVAAASGEFELAKMAVTQSLQGRGIGRRLLATAIDHARAAGAARLFLETNSKLAAAIRLYESMGFRHIPADRVPPSPYSRSDTAMELKFDFH